MMQTDYKITAETFWLEALVVALIDLVLLLFLIWRIKPVRFRELKWPLAGTSGVAWGIFAVALLWGQWDLYYRHFYPD